MNIMSYLSILEMIRVKAPMTTMYILNKVLSKSVPTTPFKLWIDRKSSLRHLYI